MRNRTFRKAFLATFALVTIGLLAVMYPTHSECASIPEDVGACSRVDRIIDASPVLLIIGVPMSVFVGLIATTMKPVERSDTKNKEKK